MAQTSKASTQKAEAEESLMGSLAFIFYLENYNFIFILRLLHSEIFFSMLIKITYIHI